MSQRFGRSKRRALREALAEKERLLEHNGNLSRAISRNNQDISRMRDASRHNDVLAQILRDARAQVTDLTAKAIIEAETEFLRSALAQLRRQGGASIELEATPRGPDLSLNIMSQDAAAMQMTVYIPAVHRSFVVALPRERRRA